MRQASVENIKIDYSDFAICECWMTKGILESGVGRVIVARKNNMDQVIFGEYFVDIFYLDINNCFLKVTDLFYYQNVIKDTIMFCHDLEFVEPVFAKTFLYCLGEYSEKFFSERPYSFRKAEILLGDFSIDHHQEFCFEKIAGLVT